MYKCDDSQFNICLNNAMCFRCQDGSLFKEPKWMQQQKKKKEKVAKKRKEGMEFEKRVQSAYNKKVHSHLSTNVPRNKTARRQIGSGSIWCWPSDIVTENELIECKERGSTTSRGEKTITIQKQHLTKVKLESALANKKTWYYVFGFKNDEEIYLVKDFNEELTLIHTIKKLQERIVELENELHKK